MPNTLTIADSEGSQVTEYNNMLDELIQYRTKAMGKAPSNRCTRIYHKRHEQKNINIHQIALED
jgi:hypothetical protein